MLKSPLTYVEGLFCYGIENAQNVVGCYRIAKSVELLSFIAGITELNRFGVKINAFKVN